MQLTVREPSFAYFRDRSRYYWDLLARYRLYPSLLIHNALLSLVLIVLFFLSQFGTASIIVKLLYLSRLELIAEKFKEPILQL